MLPTGKPWKMLPTLPPLVGIGEGGEAGVCGSVLPPAAVHGSVGVREEKQIRGCKHEI